MNFLSRLDHRGDLFPDVTPSTDVACLTFLLRQREHVDLVVPAYRLEVLDHADFAFGPAARGKNSENSKANPINSVKSACGIWEKFVRWSREK
jgi:hypothetical protein